MKAPGEVKRGNSEKGAVEKQGQRFGGGFHQKVERGGRETKHRKEEGRGPCTWLDHLRKKKKHGSEKAWAFSALARPESPVRYE